MAHGKTSAIFFWGINAKTGTLRQTTYLYTGNVCLKIKRGTEVMVEGSVLRTPNEGMTVMKAEGRFYANLWGTVRSVTLPEGGSPPYPLSMMR